MVARPLQAAQVNAPARCPLELAAEVAMGQARASEASRGPKQFDPYR